MSTRLSLVCAGAALAVTFAAGPLRAQEPDTLYPIISIAGSRAEIAEIVRPGPQGLVTFRYRVATAATSDAGIKSLGVDISAPRSVLPEVLWVNGQYTGDATEYALAPASHVRVALEVPTNWNGYISQEGLVEWYSRSEGRNALFAIAPGSVREDFTLHSDRLPGVRAYRLLPDYPHRCCPYEAGDPRNAEIDVKEAEDFMVEGQTIGPTFAPDAMSATVLQSQLEASCSAHGWIRSATVCQSLEATLAEAASLLSRGKKFRGKRRLRRFLEELEAQHGPGLPVDNDAYWMLKTNAAYLLSVT